MAKITLFYTLKNIFIEENDQISIEIFPSIRTEAVEDRDVIFDQIKGSKVKCYNLSLESHKRNFIIIRTNHHIDLLYHTLTWMTL